MAALLFYSTDISPSAKQYQPKYSLNNNNSKMEQGNILRYISPPPFDECVQRQQKVQIKESQIDCYFNHYFNLLKHAQ